MKSSLKKLVSLMLVVVMIITTNNFNSFSLTLDTLVRNEIEINKERNKNNNTKYYEEFLSEKKQYLLNDEGNASKATTKNNDIDKTVKDYLVDGNMDNINKDIESYIENNKSSNDTDNGNQVNDEDENEKSTFNDDNAINNKINDATNKSTNNDENKNDVQADVFEDDIIEDDIDNVVSDAIAITNASNIERVDDKLNDENNSAEVEVAIDSDLDLEDENSQSAESVVFGDAPSSIKKYSNLKIGDVITFGKYPQNTTDPNTKEPLEWIVIATNEDPSDSIEWSGGHYIEVLCKNVIGVGSQLDYDRIIDPNYEGEWYKNFCSSKHFTNEELNIIGGNSKNFLGMRINYDFSHSLRDELDKGIRHREILDAPITHYAYSQYSKISSLKKMMYGIQGWQDGTPVPYWTEDWIMGEANKQYIAYYPDSNQFTYVGSHTPFLSNKTYDHYAYGCQYRTNQKAILGLRPRLFLKSDGIVITKSKITWNRDGGNWKDAKYTPIEEYEEGKITSLPTEKDIIKTGYKLDGWYINTDRTKTYKEIPATQTGAITLTAKWTKTITQYKINWQLKGGTFKDEYKHYETDKHNDTEDFILPTEDMLNPPYGKIFKEWMVEGVATTSIAKEIKKDVTVEVNWAKSTGSFESFNIGTYKTTIEDTEKEVDLDWLILDKKDDKLLLMTKNVIDNVSYDKNGNANFKNSSIKKWLNNDFYDKTFDDKQKRNIFNDKNNGKVFLLTKEQFNEYFATNMQSLAEATEYAGSVNNGGEKLDLRGSLSPYWLMATEGTKVPYVQNDGILNESGIEANAKTIGVRPCIWVEEKKMDEVSVFDVGKFFRSLSDNLKPFFARFFGIIW